MNIKELKELIELIQKGQIAELELEKSGVRVRIKRDRTPAVPVPLTEEAPAASTIPVEAPLPHGASPPSTVPAGWLTLTAPVVGTFYRAPAPDSDPYVEIGSPVKKGQILCVIEAMKLMNEIESEWEGKIVEILVENAQPVEYGAPLFRIEPLAPT
ncbi:MAG TPA: acetyl-CoA carboxylase biotin carboxyl carrier protein [Nitrospiria bacterium]|jgi:acetyl-CoA carboxylase biotin carboxyl carrier protein|nr:acetyl-CoA carboxylase biotin carboxyl carrier protein [Nitrospiria bacterium]